MSTYTDALDVCECGHRAFMHAVSQGHREHCVDVTHYKACPCRKFVPKEEAK